MVSIYEKWKAKACVLRPEVRRAKKTTFKKSQSRAENGGVSEAPPIVATERRISSVDSIPPSGPRVRLQNITIRDSLRDSLRKELRDRTFISRQALQVIIPRDKIRQLLEGTSLGNPDDLSEHISTNALKFLALLILKENDAGFLRYLESPLDITDDAYYGRAERYNDNFDLWKEPAETIHGSPRNGHWIIPPVLNPYITIKYPQGFILPFYHSPEKWTPASSFPVFKAQVGGGHLECGSTVATVVYKKIEIDPKDYADAKFREVKSMRARRHRSILPLLAAFVVTESESRESLYIVTPYAEGGDMHDWIHSQKTPSIPPDLVGEASREKFIDESIMSLSEALAYLHSKIDGQWCGHFDIKPRNILLFLENGKWIWKIADFGHSDLKNWELKGTVRDGLGTNTYQPPEYRTSTRETRYGPSFDVWSLGCVLLELLTIRVFSWADDDLGSLIKDLKKTLASTKDFCFHIRGVVPGWLDYIKPATKDRKVIRGTNIILGMLKPNFKFRLYAFDAALDFLELFDPSMAESQFDKTCKRITKGQTPTDTFGELYDPILRIRDSSEHNNGRFIEIRTRYLEDEGWAPRPVAQFRRADTKSFSNLPCHYQKERLYGRDDLKAKLRSKFQRPNTVVLVGLAGIGKSHLAYDFFSQAQDEEFENGNVLYTFWVRCRNKSTFEEAYQNIYRIIKYPGQKVIDPERIIPLDKVKKLLLSLQCKWMLVLDGVEDTDAQWLSHCPFQQSGEPYGKILVTTRNKEVANRWAPHDSITVESLDEKHSVDLLLQGIDTIGLGDQENAKKLVRKLHLPILIKLFALQFRINSPGGQTFATYSERLSDRDALIQQLGQLSLRDPRIDELQAVHRIWDLVFGDFFKGEDAHYREIFRLLCHFSNDRINRSWLEPDFGKEKLEESFSAFANRGYLQPTDGGRSCYAMHDVVQAMFLAWLRYKTRSKPENAARDRWTGHLRVLAMLYADLRPLHGKRADSTRQTPGHLMKLRYKDHVEEFLKYAADPNHCRGKFKQAQAVAAISFARSFEGEGRVDVSERLLRLVIGQGIDDDENRQMEIHARRDLVHNLTRNAWGRNKAKSLRIAYKEAEETLQIALGVGHQEYIWKTRREMLHLFCKMGRLEAAKAQLTKLYDTYRDAAEADDLKLSLRGCEDLYNFSVASIKGSAYDIGKLEELLAQKRQEVKELQLSIGESKSFEGLESAMGDLATICLTLMEAVGPGQREDKINYDRGVTLAKEARELYNYVSEQRLSRYKAEQRDYEDHKHIIDADVNLAVACLRRGLWASDKYIVKEAAESLRKALVKYEGNAHLGISNADVRRAAYWRQNALKFLDQREETANSEYGNELAQLNQKYDLLKDLARDRTTA